MIIGSFAGATVKLPAVFRLSDGTSIKVQTDAQLKLVPKDAAFLYMGVQDGVAFYQESQPS